VKVARTVLRGPRRSNAPGLPDQGLRPLKTQQKISGRLTSPEHTRHRLRLRSYLTTAAKQKVGILDALQQAIAGNPWQPSGPALAT